MIGTRLKSSLDMIADAAGLKLRQDRKDAHRTGQDQARAVVARAAAQGGAIGRLHRPPQGLREKPRESCITRLRLLCQTLDVVLRPRGLILRLDVQEGAAHLELCLDLNRCLVSVVAELVVNAAKHGFPPGVTGRITVVVSRMTDYVSFTVVDDGSGILSRSSSETPRGMRWAGNLVTQAGGQCRWEFSRAGTRASVTLPIEPPAERATMGQVQARVGRSI